MNARSWVETDDRLPLTLFSMFARTCLRGMALALLLVGSGLNLPGPVQAQPMCPPDDKEDRLCFDMVPSATAASCLPNASARVRIKAEPGAEKMDVDVSGLPPNTGFDFFVIQVPNAPFGLSWYQGDIETNKDGRGHGRFAGRFNTETFIVATNVAAAPVVHDDGTFPDADMNPQTAPVHTFHLGLWFDSPAAAAAAGCPGATTPFNGDHTAGTQALSTRNFADDQGPLRQLAP
jgi:hypothetical protein